jgi:hypothetical protein
MTAESTAHALRARWYYPWIMFVAGLIVGFFVGRYTLRAATTGGNCIRSDGTVVARNVSQQSCQATCSTCSWVEEK